MNDPEKLYLLCQCLDEILHCTSFVLLNFTVRGTKTTFIQYVYQKSCPKLSMYLVPTLTAVVEESFLVAQPASLIVQYLIPKFIE